MSSAVAMMNSRGNDDLGFKGQPNGASENELDMVKTTTPTTVLQGMSWSPRVRTCGPGVCLMHADPGDKYLYIVLCSSVDINRLQ